VRLHPRYGRRLSGWLILVLLFAQLATAAYACPRTAAAGAADTAVGAMADMPGCEGALPGAMDPDQPQLCKAQCEYGSQTVNAAAPIDVPAPTLMLAVLDWSPRAPLLAAPGGPRYGQVPSGAAPPGSPPLYLSLLVLRD
jgi:hypothetical protein